MKGEGKQRATEEPKGRKWPAGVVYGPPVYCKQEGGTQPSIVGYGAVGTITVAGVHS